jgi:hypothetical protein
MFKPTLIGLSSALALLIAMMAGATGKEAGGDPVAPGDPAVVIPSELPAEAQGETRPATAVEAVVDVPTVTLDRSVQFLAPDGRTVEVGPGTYITEGQEDNLRLRASPDTEPLVIQATKTSHEEQLDGPVALSIAGQEDTHYLMLLRPGGESLEAVGSYSGVRPRGALPLLDPRLRQQALIGAGAQTPSAPQGKLAPNISVPAPPTPPLMSTLQTSESIPSVVIPTFNSRIAGAPFRTTKVPLEQCSAECLVDGRCKAYTWEKQNTQCELLAAPGPSAASSTHISGTKQRSSSGTRTLVPKLGKWFGPASQDLLKKYGVSLGQCSLECLKDPQCQAFTWWINPRPWCQFLPYKSEPTYTNSAYLTGIIRPFDAVKAAVAQQRVGQPEPRTHLISLKAANGNYVTSYVTPGLESGRLYATQVNLGPWDGFFLIDLNGGDLKTGDAVRVRSLHGRYLNRYLTAERELQGLAYVNSLEATAHETFTIVKMGASDQIISLGDAISLKDKNGQYVVAEGGGGSALKITSPIAGQWETFRLVAGPRPPQPPVEQVLTDNACVADVPSAFNNLKQDSQWLKAWTGQFIPRGQYRWVNRGGCALAYNDPNTPDCGYSHFQGIQRLNRDPYLAITGASIIVPGGIGQAGHLFIVKMGSRPSKGAWGSNLPRPSREIIIDPAKSGTEHSITPDPPLQDRVVQRVDVDYEILHPGGLSVVGDYAVLGLGGETRSEIVFFDVSIPELPRRLATRISIGQPDHSSVAIARRPDGKYLLATLSIATKELRFYRSAQASLEATTFGDEMVVKFSDIVRWWGGYQNINFVKQCDGRLFLIGTDGDTDILDPTYAQDFAQLFAVDNPDSPSRKITYMGVKYFESHPFMSNFNAGGGAFVTKGGDLLLYGAFHWPEDKKKKIRMGEFAP